MTSVGDYEAVRLRGWREKQSSGVGASEVPVGGSVLLKLPGLASPPVHFVSDSQELTESSTYLELLC